MIKKYNGDCFKILDELINQEVKVDMVLVDLPYGKTKNNWDIKLPMNSYIEVLKNKKIKKMNFEEFLIYSVKKGLSYKVLKEQWNEGKKDGIWDKLNKLIKQNSAIVMFGQGDFSAELIHSNKKMYRYSLIWEKDIPSQHLNSNKMPMNSHEDILIFYKNLPTYNPQKYKGTMSHGKGNIDIKKINNNNYGDFKILDNSKKHKNLKFPRSILKFSKVPSSKMLHPTQKPFELIEYLIKTYSNENDLILDFTSGIGTTGIAAEENNRKAILIEKEEKFYNISLSLRKDQLIRKKVLKNRLKGIKYQKPIQKKEKITKKLKELIYINPNLKNKELLAKLEISERQFYRNKYNLIANDLRSIYKQQSLF